MKREYKKQLSFWFFIKFSFDFYDYYRELLKNIN